MSPTPSSSRLSRPVHVFFLVNEGIAFLLELLILVVLAWWGFSRDVGWVGSLALAVAAPAAAAVVWGMFAAPKARYAVPLAAQLAVKAVVYGAATLALFALGQRQPALWFAVAVVVNTALSATFRTYSARSRS
ncbi:MULTISPECIES: YrdB family protein [unclassified Streptomyces]|uniref:YrdB family protein n=1 Tax=unclassified Streptomyces TaxID=2593676 RepID=UPI00202F8E34|nr:MULTISPECIES: YrdB family protein [unclassified Streptomyces]MCM1971420.1 YrdB family protein [Streptomyces sp. G1]MCX5299029.1 YrdB family protein [Streptomyces sp. NBC_00193]